MFIEVYLENTENAPDPTVYTIYQQSIRSLIKGAKSIQVLPKSEGPPDVIETKDVLLNIKVSIGFPPLEITSTYLWYIEILILKFYYQRVFKKWQEKI